MGPANPGSMECQRDEREGGTRSMECQRDQRGLDQQTLGPWCARGTRERVGPGPWSARGTRERVGPANPGSMVCQRDQREGGTSKPWVHGVPEGPERGWDQQTLGPWCARGTRERVGPTNPGSMVCQRDQREGGTRVHGVPEGPERGWDQVHGVPEGPERGWDQGPERGWDHQTLGPWSARGTRERVGPANPGSRGTRERVGPANPGSMECQRDHREGGTSKPWIHGVPEGPERGKPWVPMECQRDQREGGTSKPWVHGVPEGPERGWDQQTLGPWSARGTRDRVGPANPGSMVCQRDQREGGTSKPWVHAWSARGTRERVGPVNPGSMECQRDQREGGTSKPWVHGVPEGPERGWDQQTLGPWCARGTRERVGPVHGVPEGPERGCDQQTHVQREVGQANPDRGTRERVDLWC